MRGLRTAAAALLTASLVLTGCGGAADSAGPALADSKGADTGAAGRGYEQSAPGDADAKGPEAAKKPAAVQQQHVIRTAELYVEVADATRALATARRVVQGAGGHVSNESTERIDDTHVTSRVVLRVPQERYDAVLKELAGTGKLLSRKADAKDVTEQVVDVESRIATQRASVARVRALMDRATKLSDVVTLEGELSRRQSDLESLLAQQASLKDRTTMATVTLELSEKEREKSAEDDGRPGFLDALGGGWSALVAALAWAGIVLAAVAPWLAVLVVLYAAWRWLFRPLRSRPGTPAAGQVTESATGPGTAAESDASSAPPAP